jgi:hypothetical protein
MFSTGKLLMIRRNSTAHAFSTLRFLDAANHREIVSW